MALKTQLKRQKERISENLSNIKRFQYVSFFTLRDILKDKKDQGLLDKEFTAEVKSWFVKKCPEIIMEIDNPSEKLLKIAFTAKPLLIANFKLSIEMQRWIVKTFPNNMCYIDNIDEDIQYEMVTPMYTHIAYIRNPSQKIQSLVITKGFGSIYCIAYPSDQTVQELTMSPEFRIQEKYFIPFVMAKRKLHFSSMAIHHLYQVATEESRIILMNHPNYKGLASILLEELSKNS